MDDFNDTDAILDLAEIKPGVPIGLKDGHFQRNKSDDKLVPSNRPAKADKWLYKKDSSPEKE
jgi:hypothetical protein